MTPEVILAAKAIYLVVGVLVLAPLAVRMADRNWPLWADGQNAPMACLMIVLLAPIWPIGVLMLLAFTPTPH